MFRNKRGQLDYPIIAFVVLFFALLLFAPIMLKIIVSVRDTFSPSLGNLTNSGGAIAEANVNAVLNPFVTFWDKVIMSAFVLGVLFLIISAFLIDTSPFWVILYIFLSFMLVLFIPTVTSALDVLYSNSAFTTPNGGVIILLPIMNFLRTHFTAIVVGLMVITGIIIYGKLFLGGGNNRR